MLSKKVISVHSLLENIKDIPMLKTERLVLDSVTANDISDYNKLCLDESLNKYWGYDYHEDLKGELTESFFVDSAKEDFENEKSIFNHMFVDTMIEVILSEEERILFLFSSS